MYDYYGSYYPFHMFGFGFLFIILFWIIVIAVFYRLFRDLWPRSGHRPHGRSSAVDILKERYAKGEITKEQLEEMRRVVETE